MGPVKGLLDRVCQVNASFSGAIETYETLVNTVRSGKSILDFIGDSPKYLSEYISSFNWSVVEHAEPFSAVLGNAKDFLTFIEVFIRFRKLREGWNKAEALAADKIKAIIAKNTSMCLQLGQKLIESALLIPNSWKLYDLAAACTKIGTWTGFTYATVERIFIVRELFVLGASSLAIYATTCDLRKHEWDRARKWMRVAGNESLPGDSDRLQVKGLSQIVELIKQAKLGEENLDENIIGSISGFQGARRKRGGKEQLPYGELLDKLVTLKSEQVNLSEKIMQSDPSPTMNKLQKEFENLGKEIEKIQGQYLHRLFLEVDLNILTETKSQQKALEEYQQIFNEHFEERLEEIQEIVDATESSEEDVERAKREKFIISNLKQELELKVSSISTLSSYDRLEKIFTYKWKKDDVQIENSIMHARKAIWARRFDISKVAIVTLGLGLMACGSIPVLAPFAFSIGACSWFTLLGVGVVGMIRTWNLAFYSEAIALPNSTLVLSA